MCLNSSKWLVYTILQYVMDILAVIRNNFLFEKLIKNAYLAINSESQLSVGWTDRNAVLSLDSLLQKNS